MFKKAPNREYNKKLYVPNSDFIPTEASANIENIFNKIEKNIGEFKQPKNPAFNLNARQRKTLAELKNSKTLIVIPSDKNLGPVLLTTEQYLELCYKHLKDEKLKGQSTYLEYKGNETILEKRLRATVIRLYKRWIPREKCKEKIKDMKIITNEIETKTINSMYGLVKIHKKVLSIRPIISNAKGILNGLSKWVDYQLQKHVRNLDSFIKDSDELLTELREIEHHPTHAIFTFDVVSMYTNIDTNRAISLIEKWLPMNTTNGMIIQGLKVIMKNNYFKFDGKVWYQQNGTAMGTASAPAYAVLFLGIAEKMLQKKFKKYMVLNKRFIDDGLIIWKDVNDKLEVRHYLAHLTRVTGLQFTLEEHLKEATFLDLKIYWKNGRYLSKTHEKELNLHLFIPSTSAHPSGILKSIIYGRVKKFKTQNSEDEHFLENCQKLVKQLEDRGYEHNKLMRLMNDAKARLLIERTKTTDKNVFVKLPFKSGTDKTNISNIFCFKELKTSLKETANIDNIMISYSKPKNLKELICPTEKLCNPRSNI